MEKIEKAKSKKIKIVVLAILLIVIGTFLFGEQNVEQYYIDGTYYASDKLVINNYEQYMQYFQNDDKVLNLLNNRVDDKFFDTNSIIIVQDSSFSAGGIDGYVSRMIPVNRKAIITIKRNELEYGEVAVSTRTYFIPVKSKNITDIKVHLKYPLIDALVDYAPIIPVIMPLILFMLFIIYYIKALIKNEISTTDKNDKRETRKELIKSLLIRTAQIILIAMAFLIGLEVVIRIIVFVMRSIYKI